jgi:hypothetical protein
MKERKSRNMRRVSEVVRVVRATAGALETIYELCKLIMH